MQIQNFCSKFNKKYNKNWETILIIYVEKI